MSDDALDDLGGEEAPERPASPPASEKQLNFLRVLQQRIGIGDDELAAIVDEVAGKEALDDLTVREASELIDELQTQARERGVDLDTQPGASDKQLNFIRSLKRRAHLTDDELAALLQEKAGVGELDALGKRDASAVIDALLAKADGQGGGGGGRGARSKAPARPRAAPAPPPPPEEYDDDVPF